jgi:hypothetical protein
MAIFSGRGLLEIVNCVSNVDFYKRIEEMRISFIIELIVIVLTNLIPVFYTKLFASGTA